MKPESFKNQTGENSIEANPKKIISKIISAKNRVRTGIFPKVSNSAITSASKINLITVGVKNNEERFIAINTGKNDLENIFLF